MRWNGSTVGIFASGPSLTREDARLARFRCERIIAVNESYRLAPMGFPVDVVYAADSAWWLSRDPRKVAPNDLHPREFWTQHAQWSKPPENINVMQSKPGAGLPEPGGDVIFTGANSGFQALGLALLWGARRVVFLGLDLTKHNGRNHWHEDHAAPLRNDCNAYGTYRSAFEAVASRLRERGVDVVNATPRSALKCFPIMTPQEAFGE